MEIEAAHCALRHQTGGLDLFELVHAGETPIGPHVNLLRFRSNTWKLIADLMVNAAVNHERCNGNDMGNRGNFWTCKLRAEDNPIPSWSGRGCERRRLYQ